MIDVLDAGDWAEILDDARTATPGGIVETLTERFDMDAGDAEQLLDDCLNGHAPITLDKNAGMFGRVVVDANDGETTRLEADTGDANPTLDTEDRPTSSVANQQSTDETPDALVSDTPQPRFETAPSSNRDFNPEHIKGRSWWSNWVLARPYNDDGEVDHDATATKQPVAPYDRGDARPVSWHFGLDESEHPCTDFEEANPWTGLDTTMDVFAPDRVVSDKLGLGIILPVNQGPDRPDDRTVVLIDWDDVRDPETEEIHPVVGRALAETDCYAEISQSGEGIHQFVFGEIPGGLSKFIRHIDTEPFVGDDLPAVEMYQSGRVCAMTGDHIEGTGDDVAEAQDMIDRLCWDFGTADNAGPGTPTDPFSGQRDDTEEEVDRVPDHDTVGTALRDAAAYDGPDPDDWEIPAEWSLEYAAVLRARERSDELAGVANWELLGYAAAFGHRDGLTKAEILADLKDHPTPQYGFDKSRAEKEIRGVFRKADADNYHAPSRSTLAHRGILPDRFADRRDHGDGHVVALPEPVDHDAEEPPEEPAKTTDAGELPPEGELTITDAQDNTKAAVTEAIRADDDVLVDAMMGTGKSYSSVAAAVETNTPVTILTGRGRKEQYDQLRTWAEQKGLDVGTKGEPDGDVFILPAFQADCNTANGDHGDDWGDLVGEWYSAGATPSEIHAQAEWTLENDPDHDHEAYDHDGLPCQSDGACDYTRRWDFDPDDFDILVGHYAHGHKLKVTTGRVVLLDEFPEAYEATLGDQHLKGAVTRYLQEYDRLPFDNWTDLIGNRDDHQRRADALGWLENRGVDPDERGAMQFDDDNKHALAPVAIYTILKAAAGGTLGNGYERAELPNGIGIFDHGSDRKSGKPAVHFLRPARGLRFADHVVGLDGTPTPVMWDLATGLEFEQKTTLQGRRAEYLEVALQYRIIQTTDAVKPYNNPDHVHVKRDAALLEGIAQHHGEKPAVITTSTARYVWDDEEVIEYNTDAEEVESGPAGDIMIHGNVLGSNRYKNDRLGCLIGSNHYGDGFVKRWGAYAGKAVTREDNPRSTANKTPLSYGDFGDRILQHMREHDTLQALLRFARNGGGATVYVDTDTLPEWVPVQDRADVTAAGDGMSDVLRALAELGQAGTVDITEHDAVDLSQRQVRKHVATLRDMDMLEAEADPNDGRRTLYHIDADGGLTEYGFTDLPAATNTEQSSGRFAYVDPLLRDPSGKSEEKPPNGDPDRGDPAAGTDGGEVTVQTDPPPDD